MKIALAQINPTIADFAGNAKKILRYAAKARDAGADLAVFPEMCVLGYPPRDLVEKPSVVKDCAESLKSIAAQAPLPMLVGFVEGSESGKGLPIHNSAAFIEGGEVRQQTRKRLLPTYDVFDEARYFEPGGPSEPISVGGMRLGVTICEDAWAPVEARYSADPIAELCAGGADAIVNLSASPFTAGKEARRRDLFAGHARRHGRAVLMVNQVGGNDELVFDGGSMAFDGEGRLAARAPRFREDLLVVDFADMAGPIQPEAELAEQAVREALVLGIRDYLHKCGFTRAVLGLSGGIDSALVACLACEALGPEHVLGVALPSQFSSQHSRDDAEALAKNLGMEYRVIPIAGVYDSLAGALDPLFADLPFDVTEENMQARIRGCVLMAISNKFGHLLLATGNKSELAVGYSTLYGDMAGGLAPISDLPKMMVYRLARHINREREVVPPNTLTKPPSAELRPDQKDQDTLPEYDALDSVIFEYVENGKDFAEICAMGFDPKMTARTIRMIESAEYKRRQAVPGLKVTSKAFGYGRRIPVAKRLPAFDIEE